MQSPNTRGDRLVWDEIDASSLVKVRANGGMVDNGSTAIRTCSGSAIFFFCAYWVV